MLYSLDGINNKIANAFKSHPQKVDLIKFFNDTNLIENVGIHSVYLHDRFAPYFIDKESMEKIKETIQEKFNTLFDYEDLYTGSKALSSVADEEAFKFTVKNQSELDKIKSIHSQHSTYGVNKQKKDAITEGKRQDRISKIEAEHEQRRQAERKKFNNMTNLGRDFSNMKIVSIDFEFSFNKYKNDYSITEMGIAISDNGEKSAFHYLIRENYEQKKNRSMQNKFDFGKTEIIPFSTIKSVINKHLLGADYVLYHEMREDNDIMQRLGYDFETENSKIQVIDTQLCYKRYFRPKNSLPNGEKLENLLESFKINAKHLHNGGNDANYTLQLLLKMSEIHKMMLKSKEGNRPKMRR